MCDIQRVMLILTVVVASYSIPSHATLLFYEGFNYPAGPLHGNTNPLTGSAWSDADGNANVASSTLTYSGLVTSPGKMQYSAVGGAGSDTLSGLTDVAAQFTQTGNVYMTMLTRMPTARDTNVPIGHGDFRLNGGLGHNIRYFEDVGEAAGIRFEFRDFSQGGTRRAHLPDWGTDTALIASRFELNATGNDVIKWFVNPASFPNEPDWNNPDAMAFGGNLTTSGWNSIASGASDTNGDVERDEIRVGTTWEDVLGTVSPSAGDREWNSVISGDWNIGGNWLPAAAPTDNETNAIFGDAIMTARTVFSDTPVTVNRITFDNSNRYVVAGPGGIHLDRGISPNLPDTGVRVVEGTHEFQTAVTTHVDTIVDVSSGSTLIFSNALNLNGTTLTKTGAGEMAIRNDLLFVGGTITIAEGNVSGNGTVSGDVNNVGGTLSPGNAQDTLQVTSLSVQVQGGRNVLPEPSACLLLFIAVFLKLAAPSRTNRHRKT